MNEETPKIPIFEIFQKGEKVGFFFDKELATKVTNYLNNPHSDEEAAFEAGRKYITIDHSEHQTFVDTQELRIKYPTFQDYQNSKNGKNDAVE